jgi:hypothetical protein
MNWLRKIAQANSVAILESLIPKMLSAAQEVYDAWDQSDEEHGDWQVGFGGICHLIAEAIADVINTAGYDAVTVDSGGMGEQHVWARVKMPDGIYDVDIPYHIYESGGGYNWTKLPNVVFETDHIRNSIDLVSHDPNEWDQYTGEY